MIKELKVNCIFDSIPVQLTDYRATVTFVSWKILGPDFQKS